MGRAGGRALHRFRSSGRRSIVAGAAIAAFLQFGSFGMASAVGGASIGVAAFESNVLTPWLMSRVGAMNAVAVFVCLIFWGWIWGVWGLLLAVPIMAAVKAVSGTGAEPGAIRRTARAMSGRRAADVMFCVEDRPPDLGSSTAVMPFRRAEDADVPSARPS